MIVTLHFMVNVVEKMKSVIVFMYINSLSLVWGLTERTVCVSPLIKYFFGADPFVKRWEQDSCEEW